MSKDFTYCNLFCFVEQKTLFGILATHHNESYLALRYIAVMIHCDEASVTLRYIVRVTYM